MLIFLLRKNLNDTAWCGLSDKVSSSVFAQINKMVLAVLLLYSHRQNYYVEMTTKQNLAWIALTP